MDDVEAFIRKHQNTQSARNRLTQHEEAIRRMREAGLSFRLIAKYLKEHGVDITQNSIRVFYQKHIALSAINQNAYQENATKNNITANENEINNANQDNEYVTSPFTGEKIKRSELFGLTSSSC